MPNKWSGTDYSLCKTSSLFAGSYLFYPLFVCEGACAKAKSLFYTQKEGENFIIQTLGNVQDVCMNGLN